MITPMRRAGYEALKNDMLVDIAAELNAKNAEIVVLKDQLILAHARLRIMELKLQQARE